ncbi:angiopoietin-1-like [Mytilus galloprovincialis]|uniref:angiopoietin-1-like n=1 Tax=Mytilus galloprovincialis TaxID=29158 RepID=UPI003F7C69E6
MDYLSLLKILKYGLILCLLLQLTTAVNDDDVDVPLLDTQNAPLFATLDMSKANRRIEARVLAAVKAQIGILEEKLNEYVSDIENNSSVSRNNELRIVVENVLKEKGYDNLTAVVTEYTDTILQVVQEFKQLVVTTQSHQKPMVDVSVVQKGFDNLTAVVKANTDKIPECKAQQKQLPAGTNKQEKAIPHECADINFSKDGVFLIYPSGAKRPKYAYCVLQDNRRWTVFQRRSDLSFDFDRYWSEYREGFGVSSGTHWIGNDYIHAISTSGRHRARFILEKDGIKKYADYSNFRVGDEHSNYMLNVSGYSGTAGDSLNGDSSSKIANGQKFSAYDKDNDHSSGHCARRYKGGWWYNSCYYASLNNGDSNKIDWGVNMGLKLDKSTAMITRE